MTAINFDRAAAMLLVGLYGLVSLQYASSFQHMRTRVSFDAGMSWLDARDGNSGLYNCSPHLGISQNCGAWMKHKSVVNCPSRACKSETRLFFWANGHYHALWKD